MLLQMDIDGTDSKSELQRSGVIEAFFEEFDRRAVRGWVALMGLPPSSREPVHLAASQLGCSETWLYFDWA
jgi:hypothetical protein